MRKILFNVVVFTAVVVLTVSCEKSEDPVRIIIDFEELDPGEEGFWNGSDGSGGFRSGVAFFPNSYWEDWDSWVGFAYSNHTDTVSSDLDNQYSTIAGSGASGSDNFALFFSMGEPDTITFDFPVKIVSTSVTNSTYTYMTILEGGPFSKKFGGDSGNDPDWFKVLFTGIDCDGLITGTKEFYLADYRFDDNSLNYIVDTWTEVSLASLGYIRYLQIEFFSSDTNEFGVLTPSYICIDNIVTELLPDAE